MRQGAPAGRRSLGRPHRLGVPLGPVVVDRDEGGLAAHGQAARRRRQAGVDLLSWGIDLGPLRLGVRLGDARRFEHAVTSMCSNSTALFQHAGDRRRVAGIGRRGQRDVALTGQQA